MLARALPGVVVAVGRRRDLVGRAVEQRFGPRRARARRRLPAPAAARATSTSSASTRSDLLDRPLPARPAARGARGGRARRRGAADAHRGGQRGRAARRWRTGSGASARTASRAACLASARSTGAAGAAAAPRLPARRDRAPGALRARRPRGRAATVAGRAFFRDHHPFPRGGARRRRRARPRRPARTRSSPRPRTPCGSRACRGRRCRCVVAGGRGRDRGRAALPRAAAGRGAGGRREARHAPRARGGAAAASPPSCAGCRGVPCSRSAAGSAGSGRGSTAAPRDRRRQPAPRVPRVGRGARAARPRAASTRHFGDRDPRPAVDGGPLRGRAARARRRRRRRAPAARARGGPRRRRPDGALRQLGVPRPRLGPAGRRRARRSRGRSTTRRSTAGSSRCAPPRATRSSTSRRRWRRRSGRSATGGILAVLIDQNVQAKDGIFVRFFGRPAATTTVAAALALKTGCPIVPGRCTLQAERPLPDGVRAAARVERHGAARRGHRRRSRSRLPRSSRPGCARPLSSGSGCTAAGRRSRRHRRRPTRSVAAGVTRAGVLVRAPNWVGDVVLALPALRDLRRDFPSARLSVLARPWVAELYRAVPGVDEVLDSRGHAADVAAAARPLRRGRAAAQLLRHRARPWRAGVPERWGYATDGRGPLLTRRCARPGVGPGPQPGVLLSRDARRPGARNGWPARRFARLPGGVGRARPPRCWATTDPGSASTLARSTARRSAGCRSASQRSPTCVARRIGATVAIVGSAAERPLGEAIAAQLQAPVRVLSGETTLGGLVGVLKRLRLLLTNDSGPDAPRRGRSARRSWPSSARRTGPRRRPSAAAPCWCAKPSTARPACLRECPIDHRCMTRVDVGRVVEAALAAAALTPCGRPAIFMDRDGTLSHEVGYVNHPEPASPVPLDRRGGARDQPRRLARGRGDQPGRHRARLLPAVGVRRGPCEARRTGRGGRRALRRGLRLRAPPDGRRAAVSRRTATAASRGPACCGARRPSSAPTCRAPGWSATATATWSSPGTSARAARS